MPPISDPVKYRDGSGEDCQTRFRGRRTQTRSSHQVGDEAEARVSDLLPPLGIIGRTRHRA